MSFDVLAPHYGWMERVLAGNTLQRCRTAFIEEIQRPREILMLGEGAGRCLVELLARFPEAQVTCVEASAGMIKQMKRALARRALDPARVKWVHADVFDWSPPTPKYDLLVSHFFLDCFRAGQLQQLVSRVASAAAPNASWLLADFCQSTGGVFPRWRARLILWTMYRFFRVVTRLPASELTNPDCFLLKNGFVLQQRHTYEWGLLHTDLWTQSSGMPGQWS